MSSGSTRTLSRDRALQRARRLLALSTSVNANEAASARRMLDALKSDWHFVESDLVESASLSLFEVAVSSSRYGGFDAEWKWCLVSDVAAACGCEAAYYREGRRGRVVLVGGRGEVREAEVVFYSLYELLRSEGELVVAKSFRSRPDLGVADVGWYARGFLLGMSAAVTQRILEGRMGEGEDEPASCDLREGDLGLSTSGVSKHDPGAGALVPVPKVRARWRRDVGARRREAVCPGAFASGYARGMRVRLPAVCF